jgi:3-oxoacyl-[acyl-carrier protein] reductase
MINDRKLVVVTGTSGGLGSVIAKRLIGSGFFVVGISRRPVEFRETVQQSNGEYQHIIWDLSRIEALKELSDTIVRTIGTPFGLINNAAIGTDGILPTMHNSEIQNLMTVNVVSPIVLTKYLVRPMLSVRDGRIINISSIVADSGYRGLAAYGATKAAIEGFTRSFSRDVGPRSITVNAVAPGFLATEMTNGLDERDLARIANRSAMKRFAHLDEVAAAVEFLLSEAASGITGSVLTVDAGSRA